VTRFPFAATAALLIVSATSAAAQITTTIVPPKQPPAAQAAAARREAAAQDSIARVTLTDMKTWVDSAAASLALRPDTGAPVSDTAAAVPQPATPADTAHAAATPQRPRAEPEFRDGARAPDTATSLPALALAGGVLIVLGAAMRRRAARATSRTPR
jgi:hypothetical protein